MVSIEIEDELWKLHKRSWALFGVRTHRDLVRMLKIGIRERALSVIDDAKGSLVSDEPEALVLREVGLKIESMTKKLVQLGLSVENAEKFAEKFVNKGKSP